MPTPERGYAYVPATAAPDFPGQMNAILDALDADVAAVNATATDAAAAAAEAASAPAAAGGGGSAVTALATFGDSITAAGQGGGIYWHRLVADWLGIPAFNPSVAGERPTDIAVRQGGVAPAVTLTGNTIPATVTPVAATTVTPTTDWIGGDESSQRSKFVGRLAGIPGTLHKSATGWTFTRTTAAAEPTPVPPASVFRIDDAAAHRADIQTFWGGRNSAATLVRDTTSMAAYLLAPARFLVLAVLTSSADTKGTAGHTGNQDTNASLLSSFGDAYLDMRRFLIDHGLRVAGLTPTAQDTTDIANDTVPASLRADSIHPNASGHWAIAWKVATELVARGWVPAAGAAIPAPLGGAHTPTAGTGLKVPDAYATATARATPALAAAQSFSVRVRFTPTTVGVNMQPVRRIHGTNTRAWTLYVLSNGNLRLQMFSEGTSTPNVMADSTAAATLTAGTPISIRVDRDAVAKTVTFYTSANGTTWTQLGSVKTGVTAAVFNSTAPVAVGAGGLVGTVQSVSITTLDGATTYLAEDFTDGTADGWSLNGTATL